MKKTIPKYILQAIDKRRKYGEMAMQQDDIISEFCLKSGIKSDHLFGSFMILTEPHGFQKDTIKEIEEQLNK
ncbi:hypothetical protein [Vallitalea guaymasensis]|uniref:hypothetical protein n=1 Tax=Vallitalea guaymasensis TaxID=1185412 RepID=UPI000DE4B232|nr:hypothetical protein [Vallitalea guaymasensis]